MVETTSGDGWTPNKVHDWVMTIKEDLNQHAEEMQTRSRCRRKMYRVRTNLRQLKPEHYDAEQISLGLFDRFPCRASISRADRCRTAMAHTFLEVMGMTMDELCELVVPGPKEMQDLYDEIGRTPLSLKEVQFVLTLDAVFVACWFATEYDPGFRQDFPAFHAAREAIVPIFELMDLFKVENQIPLSLLRVVLLILVEKAEPEKKHEEQVAKANKFLSNLCVGIISDMRVDIPGFDPENPEFDNEDIQHLESLECEHLLDFLHQMMCHGIKREDENFDQGSMEHGARTSDTRNWWPNFCGSERFPLFFIGRKVSPNITYQEQEITLPSVAQLQKAGIEFQGLGGRFHEVKFIPGLLKGTLCLPLLTLTDDTEPLWRNIVAYEDIQPNFCNQDFTSYLIFMDEIIESEKDVQVLKTGTNNSSAVICEDGLGEGKAIARVFNNTVLKNCILRVSDKKYQDHRRKIKAFYDQGKRRLILEFIQTYFGKPWLTISVVAATILLIATLFQTYYTVAGYYKAYG